jgi:hypothetical protein
LRLARSKPSRLRTTIWSPGGSHRLIKPFVVASASGKSWGGRIDGRLIGSVIMNVATG